MGKTRGFQIDLPMVAYYPGQTIQGKVRYEAEEDFEATVVKIILNGDAKVEWSEGSGQHRTTYTNREFYISNEIILQKGSGGDPVTVQRGFHELPFSFQLPQQIPPTFASSQGMIKYVLKAIIDRPWTLNETVSQDLTIMSVLDLNGIPESMRPADFEDEKTVCCLCCASGTISANLHIDRTGYVPGETVTVRGSCENGSSRKCNAQLRIIMHTTCTGSACCCTKQRTFDQEVFRHNLPCIEGRGRQQIDGERFVVPPLVPSGLEYCSIITQSYTLDYTVDPSMSINLKVPVPLIMGSVPLAALTSQSDNTTQYPQVANSALATNMVSFPTAGGQTSDNTENLKPQYGYYDWNKHESILNDK